MEAMDIQLCKAIASGDEEFNLREDDLGKRTLGGNNILHVAALYKQENIAKKIIDQLIYTLPEILFHQNSYGDTPLHVAAKVGCLEIVQLILNTTYKDIEKGKKLTEFVNNKKDTALLVAVKMGHFLIVKQLLGEDPELVNFVNEAKESPLFLAIEKNFLHIVELFLNIEVPRGCAYSGREGMNALHASVIRWVNIKEGECILGDKEDRLRDSQKEEGEDRLRDSQKEEENRLWQHVKLLLQHMFFKEEEEDKPSTPHVKLRLQRIMKEVIIKCPSAAVEQDEDLNWTPLHFASYFGCSEVVELILETHNDMHELVSVRDKEGMSALHIAANNGQIEVMEMLIKHCPVICELLNNKGQTAVHCAAEKGYLSSVTYLLTRRDQLNSDLYIINQQDIDGNTPAHLAAYKAIKESKYRPLLGLLWKNSQVDGTVVNNEGLTIFDIILSSENLAILYKLFFIWWLRTSRQGVPSLKGQVEEIKANMHKNKINETKGRKKDGTFEDNPKGRKEDGTFEDNTDETILRMALERTQTKRKLKILLKARKNKWRIIQNIVSSVLKFEIHKELTENNMLIATLIATVSFAAAFQVPGGYESGGLNKGQPVLRNKVCFGLFIIFDCLAFGFSSCSIFLHFYASVRRSSFSSSALQEHAIKSTGYSILAMVAAFLTSIALISKDYYAMKLAPYACGAALLYCFVPLLSNIKYLIFKYVG